ncbi:Glutathione transporter 1 [Vanrija pseudolonga]|uniref:Glutathione transporter 1 n=1 Tax=Vanrija pseudolonga TaxID=143232 RepID=A0AAF0YGI8_9TREE|nr:Glutathione transporter 1 [Vanrija pseudolonga]
MSTPRPDDESARPPVVGQAVEVEEHLREGGIARPASAAGSVATTIGTFATAHAGPSDPPSRASTVLGNHQHEHPASARTSIDFSRPRPVSIVTDDAAGRIPTSSGLASTSFVVTTPTEATHDLSQRAVDVPVAERIPQSSELPQSVEQPQSSERHAQTSSPFAFSFGSAAAQQPEPQQPEQPQHPTLSEKDDALPSSSPPPYFAPATIQFTPATPANRPVPLDIEPMPHLETQISHGDSADPHTPSVPDFSAPPKESSPQPAAAPVPRRSVAWDPATQFRPDTLESTLSAGDTPTQQFFSQAASDEGHDDDNEDDDDNVFAFHRPTTANPAHDADSDKVDFSLPPGNLVSDHPFEFDTAHPPPLSGRDNLNNGVFWASIRQRREAFGSDHGTSTAMRTLTTPVRRPTTANHRTPPATGRTDATSVVTNGSDLDDFDTDHHSGRFRARSSVVTDDLRPSTRGNMTELSGDQTVPDGRTTWGDGLGGVLKSEEGDDIDWDEDSPYAEVRASVSNIDDPHMATLTFRSIFIGILLSCVTGAINTFFTFRTPSPSLPAIVVQVAAYPIGKFFGWALPFRTWKLPRWLGGGDFSFNPCPFNIKEHTIIVMMANVSIIPAYGLHSVVAANQWYKRNFTYGFTIMYILSSQLTGLSMAGIVRRFVVFPASMLWPGCLVTTTTLNILHAESDGAVGAKITRLKFFILVSVVAFFWYFVPGFLFTGLSYFSWLCWIKPNNATVNQLFGVTTGLGMGILTFDWAQIAWVGNPLTAPWWAQVNIALGFLLFYWLLTPLLYYNNVWYTAYLPILTIAPGDRYQQPYDIGRILTPDFKLNTTAYAEYSPVYLTAAFTVTYMLAFGLTTSLIVYTVLYHGKRIYLTSRNRKTEPDDIHMKLMRRYPEVPDWWYIIAFLGCVVLGIVTIEVFATGLPVWGYAVAIAMAAVYIVPIGIIFAMTNMEPTFNLIAELIPGYAFKGQPIPGMIFKTFAVQTLAEAMYFARDMKLGHYMKIPPRSMFIAQMTACSIASFAQVGVKWLMFTNIPDICTQHNKYLLTCANSQTTFTASVIWGLIGPNRLFDKGGIYRPQLWMMLVGAVLPIPLWLWCRKYPRSILRNLNITLVFSVCLAIPPATGVNVAMFLVLGFVFQYWVRRYYFAWWAKYNYVLGAGLDVGTLTCAVFIFLVLRLPGATLNWWGNNVYRRTGDYYGAVSRILPPNSTFGPDTWNV